MSSAFESQDSDHALLILPERLLKSTFCFLLESYKGNEKLKMIRMIRIPVACTDRCSIDLNCEVLFLLFCTTGSLVVQPQIRTSRRTCAHK